FSPTSGHPPGHPLGQGTGGGHEARGQLCITSGTPHAGKRVVRVGYACNAMRPSGSGTAMRTWDGLFPHPRGMAQIVAAFVGRTDEGATDRERRARPRAGATRRPRDAKGVLIWEELMPRLVGLAFL